MLRGINITDLMLLSEKNIVDNRIVYKRAKTGKVYSIAINQYIEEVLRDFTPNETLLGLLDKNQLKKLLSDAKVNPLYYPAQVLMVEEIPKLGSGKTDFGATKKIALVNEQK